MNNYLLIFLGGGLGSMCRYFLSDLNADVPYGTGLANVLGSLILGFLLGLILKNPETPFWYPLLAIGFCGGFTTFSGFASENFKFIQNTEYFKFLIYSLGSIILGIICIFLGLSLSKYLIK